MFVFLLFLALCTWSVESAGIPGALLASPHNERLSFLMRLLVQEEQLPTINTGIFSRAWHSIPEDYVSIKGIPLSQMPVTWAEGEPNNLKSENCLTMTPQGTMADEYRSSNTSRPFFCYKQKDGYTSMNECGYNDKQYEVDCLTGHCYKFHEKPEHWSEALIVRNAEGGTLAMINSDDEAEFLGVLVAQHGPKSRVFLGVYFWFGEPWSTLDGKTLKEAGFERWMKGEPKENDSACGSMTLDENGQPQLIASPCSSKYAFICEIPPITRTPISL